MLPGPLARSGLGTAASQNPGILARLALAPAITNIRPEQPGLGLPPAGRESSLGLRVARKVDALALVACTRLIGCHILVQLCLLLIDLRLIAISLCKLNLESEDLKLQLQHLVLNLAILGVSRCG